MKDIFTEANTAALQMKLIFKGMFVEDHSIDKRNVNTL